MGEHIAEPPLEVVLRVLQQARERPADSPFMTAIQVTAALVAAGHLPARLKEGAL